MVHLVSLNELTDLQVRKMRCSISDDEQDRWGALLRNERQICHHHAVHTDSPSVWMTLNLNILIDRGFICLRLERVVMQLPPTAGTARRYPSAARLELILLQV